MPKMPNISMIYLIVLQNAFHRHFMSYGGKPHLLDELPRLEELSLLEGTLEKSNWFARNYFEIVHVMGQIGFGSPKKEDIKWAESAIIRQLKPFNIQLIKILTGNW